MSKLQIAELQGKLARRDERIAELEAELAALRAPVDAVATLTISDNMDKCIGDDYSVELKQSVPFLGYGSHDLYAAAGAAPAPSKALQDVSDERARQISEEGWTLAHDDGHTWHQMAHAAACYAYPELTALIGVKTWPWAPERFKVRDWRTNYVRAAALLIAEIERLDRIAGSKAPVVFDCDSDCEKMHHECEAPELCSKYKCCMGA